MNRLFGLLFVLAASTLFVACAEPEPAPPFAEVIDLGLERYLGTVQPASSTELEDAVTQLEFDVADGPVCLRGDSFRAATMTLIRGVC